VLQQIAGVPQTAGLKELDFAGRMCILYAVHSDTGDDVMDIRSIKLFLIAALGVALCAGEVQAGGQQLPWPFLRHYDQDHLGKIALPIGGIGTGTVSLGGRGDLRDWEIMNRPAKGHAPGLGFFAISVGSPGKTRVTRALQGPVEFYEYEGAKGSVHAGLPGFRTCSFEGGYPFGQVNLSDTDVPVQVQLRAFNPLIPVDADASGIPIAVLCYAVTNSTTTALEVSVCGSMQNFVGNDGVMTLASQNSNSFREEQGVSGIFMASDSVDKGAEQWGSIALAAPEREKGVTFRTSWVPERWGTPLLDFWDDFSADGELTNRISHARTPWASLAVKKVIPSRQTGLFRFYITWHFPNRFAWSKTNVGNYYTTKYADAWDVVRKTVPELPRLERETSDFVTAFCSSDLPATVKEAALFNLSTLRTQTCFRTADGRFFAWEGCNDHVGLGWGSCTHVWNYEQAVAFLFGSLAKSMRETEFGSQTDTTGLMSFRARLPLSETPKGKAAADGQLGCIMKMYRDWQLSGDDVLLRTLWPSVKRAVEFCWIPGGWDGDKDGVMEGCQHNTMDVEYYGPNGQMQIWYLGALRAAERMAAYMGDLSFSQTCRGLQEKGSAWADAKLFNGKYYPQLVQPPLERSRVAPALVVGMGSTDLLHPDYQLGDACLVDQLVGQYMAHVCDLGYLVRPENVKTTLNSIMKYNYRSSLHDHFNCMRTFALGEEAALLMAAYPAARPENPFPYFAEVMTGFEYTAAIGMLYEGETADGLRCIANVRDRYDGRKRSPYDEAEFGHHYGRAMASWAAGLALTGFHYSAVDRSFTVLPSDGRFFWSTGYAYGKITQRHDKGKRVITIQSLKGECAVRTITLTGYGTKQLKQAHTVKPGEPLTVEVDGRL
jgi:non-lysosomal glucosylceramidase